jgi:hypothetical protein
MGLPVQDYLIQKDLNFSKEGLVFQPRLAPLSVVSTAKNILRSGSCSIKVAEFDAAEGERVVLVDSLDFSVDAYHDEGVGTYLHRLVELRLSVAKQVANAEANATNSKIGIVGYKTTSMKSSINSIPPDVALLSDLEKISRLARQPLAPQKNARKKTLGQETYAWRHFGAMARILYIAGKWSGMPGSVNDMQRICNKSVDGPHQVGENSICEGCDMYCEYKRLQQVHRACRKTDDSMIGLLKNIADPLSEYNHVDDPRVGKKPSLFDAP